MEKYKINQELKFIEVDSRELIIKNGSDILELMGHCYEDDISSAMIYEKNLTEDFFNLKTRLAGEIFQKLAVYKFRAVFIISPKRLTARFAQMAKEENSKNQLFFCSTREEALEWLNK